MSGRVTERGGWGPPGRRGRTALGAGPGAEPPPCPSIRPPGLARAPAARPTLRELASSFVISCFSSPLERVSKFPTRTEYWWKMLMMPSKCSSSLVIFPVCVNLHCGETRGSEAPSPTPASRAPLLLPLAWRRGAPSRWLRDPSALGLIHGERLSGGLGGGRSPSQVRGDRARGQRPASPTPPGNAAQSASLTRARLEGVSYCPEGPPWPQVPYGRSPAPRPHPPRVLRLGLRNPARPGLPGSKVQPALRALGV